MQPSPIKKYVATEISRKAPENHPHSTFPILYLTTYNSKIHISKLLVLRTLL